MRILFVTSNRVGDAVLSTGLLDHLLRAHPDARITVVCGPPAEGVFARMPRRKRTIVLKKRRFNAHWLPLWIWSATHRWDLVVDIRGSVLAWLVRAKIRAVKRPTSGHKLAQLASILDLDEAPLPVAWTAPEDEAAVDALLPKGRPIIALAPTAAHPPKIWPAERFAELFRTIREEALPNAVPIVLAGPGSAERELASPLLRALPEATDLVGRLTIPEAAACLLRAALFVGNDSGLMHLASATRIPTVALFGPTSAEEYHPWGAAAAFARSDDGSMAGLSVGAAMRACRSVLQR